MIFATFEGLQGDATWMAENKSDEFYELIKISGKWELINSLNSYDVYGQNFWLPDFYYSDKPFKELIEDVVYGYSAIMIDPDGKEPFVNVWK